MAIKQYNPTTHSRRFMTNVNYKEILTKRKPEKSLSFGLSKKSGRSHGRVSIRHRGGGVKTSYRLIDFKMNKYDIPGKAKSIEYDPNRSAFIALIGFNDGEKKYILAPSNLKVGAEIIISEKKVALGVGNRTCLENIPTGMPIYNIELSPKKGGKIVKSAGSSAVITAFEGRWAYIKLPSGEIRKVDKKCFASIGSVSNPEHNKITIGKAGRKRWMGTRPTVRGKAMHPGAHPHGGGEGRSPVGLKYSKTPWGKPAKGVKTRKKNANNKMIVKRRR